MNSQGSENKVGKRERTYFKMKNSFINNFLLKLKTHHSSNRERGVYGYMWWTALKIVFLYFLIFIPIILIAKYLIDLNPFFQYISHNFSDGLILTVFFVSESFGQENRVSSPARC